MIRSAPLPAAALVLLAAVLAVGCGGDPEPPPLEPQPPAAGGPDPGEVAAVKAEIEVLRRAVADAREALDDAERRLAEAESRMAALAEGPRPSRRSDAELFRAVQGRLLADPALARVAIVAEVEGGIVVLRGVAPDPTVAAVAEQVASDVDGVDIVVSEIEVAD